MVRASEALKRGDYETAIPELTRLAEQGSAEAQAHLGYLYHVGEGVPKDLTRAAELYRLSAVQGNRDAQYNLAVAYAFGEGVAKDLSEAVTWYRRAAEQDHLISQYSLGISYAYGEGVQQDYVEAARWFSQAADKGYAPAQVHLASLYHTGEGVKQDYIEAARWYRLSAEQGDATAQYNLGLLYRGGKGVDKDTTEARRWLQLAAAQGYLAAQNELASLNRAAVAPEISATTRDEPEITEESVATKEEKSGGFFSRLGALFGGKGDTGTEVKPEIEISAQDEVKETPIEETVEIAAAETKPTEAVVEEESLKEPVLPRTETAVATEEVPEAVALPEAPASINVQESVVDNVALPQEPVAIAPEPEPMQLQEQETVEVVTRTNREEKSEGFFSRLFSGKDDEATGEITATEQSIEITSAEPVTEDLPVADPVLPETEPAEEIAAVPKQEIIESAIPRPEELAVEESIVTNVVLPKPEQPAIKVREEEVVEEMTSTDDLAVAAETDVVSKQPEQTSVVAEEIIEPPLPLPGEVAVEEAVVTNVILPKPKQPEFKAQQEEVVEEITSTDESAVAAKTDVVSEETEQTVVVEKIVEPAIPQPREVAVEEVVVTNVVLPKPKQPVEIDVTEGQEEVVKEEKSVPESVKAVDKVEPKDTGIEIIANVDEIETSIKQADARLASPSVALQADTEISETVEMKMPEQGQAITNTTPVEPIDTSQYSIDAGRRALIDSDYEQALYHFEPLARAGNTDAQSLLGNMYYNGEGVEQDYGESFLWYHLAAEQGNKNAQYLVGNMYLLGEGVKQDNDEAAYWYGKSSAQGHIAAKQNLESLLELQEINKQNESAQQQPVEETATATFESTTKTVAVVDRADEIRETEPATVITTSGISETKQPENGKKSGGFFASLFGSDDPATEVPAITAQAEVTKVEPDQVPVSTGATIASTTASVEEVEVEEKSLPAETVATGNKTQELFTLATQGDSNAQYQLATRYYSGKDVKQDYSQAAMWYRRAADQDNMDAQYSLGNMYLLGEGVQQDNNIAAQWYARAAKQGHASAQNNLDSLKIEIETEPEPLEIKPLSVAEVEMAAQEIESEPAGPRNDARLLYELGLAHSFGDGVKQDYQAAFNYFLESARKGYAAAQYKTGVAYAYGEGVKQDYAQAAEWYAKAAEQGHMIAQRNLATMYLNGNGIKQDRVKAMAWYQVIANSGNAMDVRRRDMLQKEMSQLELSASQELASQISQRLSSSVPL